MCSNYRPVTDQERMKSHFGAALPPGAAVPEVTFPGLQAPFVVRSDGTGLTQQAVSGAFGLVPHWAKEPSFGRRTYNARSETAAEKPSYRDAWRKGQRCIVPAESIYEPSWESGKAVRWRIHNVDGSPLGIAGLWSQWTAPNQSEVLSFTMLTINADEHEVFKRFHRPGDEKRMVVVLDQSEYDAWLDCPQERTQFFLKPWPAERLEARPEPKR